MVAAFLFAYFVHLTAAHAMGHRAPGLIPAPAASTSPLPAPSPSPSASPGGLVPALPPPVTRDRIQVPNITGAQPGEIEMVHMGVRLANEMLDKPCFRQWVGAATYSETNGLTSAQILDLITTQVSAVNVELYYENNRTVGFEYDPFDGVVHMNRKWVHTPDMVADNLEHEDRGHSLGFHHYGKFSTSVPYGMNYAYEGCSQQQQRARGSKAYRPPGLRIEVRHRHRKSLPKKKRMAPRHAKPAQ